MSLARDRFHGITSTVGSILTDAIFLRVKSTSRLATVSFLAFFTHLAYSVLPEMAKFEEIEFIFGVG